MTATLHPVPVISPQDPSSLLAAHTGSACSAILASSAREILALVGEDLDAILAERERMRA